MYPDDVLQTAWAVTARQMAKGQNDPILMVAEGIMQERQRWLIEAVNTMVRQATLERSSAPNGL